MLRTRYCFDIEVGLFLRVSALPLFLKLNLWEINNLIKLFITNNKTVIDVEELRDLILDGISTEELNAKCDYSAITDINFMLKIVKV